jgi:predicted DNA-binding ribbon-helix-helix protein
MGSTSLRHVRVKGRQRERVKGSPRRSRLSIRINSQLYLALQLAASTKHVTVSALVERMVWESLSKMASGNITERLRHVHALINEIAERVFKGFTYKGIER